MATLKGQNFRILVYDETAEKYKVIGLSTGCTVTLTNNVEEAISKDDVGLASKPTVVSKAWSLSCDSLNVVDAAAMLTAIKSMEPMTLMWDETSTADNQTRSKAAVARKGLAYLSDVNFTFNNRENSAKTLQFTGVGPLSAVSASEASEVIALGSYTKGQFVRLFIGSDNSAVPAKVIAFATQLSLHVALQMEDATTKDTEGLYTVQEPSGLSFDISTTALMRSGDTITSQVAGQTVADIEAIYDAGLPVKFQIANVSGDNQRTKGSVIISGSVVLSQLELSGPNRQSATYTANLNGYGEYTVGA